MKNPVVVALVTALCIGGCAEGITTPIGAGAGGGAPVAGASAGMPAAGTMPMAGTTPMAGTSAGTTPMAGTMAGTTAPMDGGMEASADAGCTVMMEGPLFPGLVENEASVGMTAWLTPNNVEGDKTAFSQNLGADPSNYLVAKDFGFSLPDTAVIEGIVVEWERSQVGPAVTDAQVVIVKGGVLGAENLAMADEWPAMGEYATYGKSGSALSGVAPQELWGEDWTAADINSADFGAAIAVAKTGSPTAWVLRVRIEVYYCPP